MDKGTKLICIDAKETGIPLVEGDTYTVTSHFERYDGAEINEDEPGVKLQELPGVFMLKRFKVASDG